MLSTTGIYRTMFKLITVIILLLTTGKQYAQTFRICERGSGIPISDALLICNNRLIASTDNDGYCKLKLSDATPDICIKALGFLDTCLIIGNDERVIYLNSAAVLMSEVTITDNKITDNELFLRFLEYSFSLSNEEDEIRSYRFKHVLKPDSSESTDQLEGVFSYLEEASRKRSKYSSLYICSAKHIISKQLFTDSITQEKMIRGNNLPIVMMDFIPLKKKVIKWYKKSLNTKPVHKAIRNSNYVFTYTDSTYFPFKAIWTFNEVGRLLEYEIISKLGEAKDQQVKSANQYCYQIYTKSGILLPESATVIRVFQKGVEVSFHSNTTLELDDANCYKNTDIKLFGGFTIGRWAKRYNISTTLTDD